MSKPRSSLEYGESMPEVWIQYKNGMPECMFFLCGVSKNIKLGGFDALQEKLSSQSENHRDELSDKAQYCKA